jgi:hypothetical protein
VERATLHGVWAKWERGTESLGALNKEVIALGREPNPYSIVSQIDREGSHYIYRLYPNWHQARIWRWGAILGEIVHNYRSALDQLVCKLAILNDVTPRKSHAFPMRRKEPLEGFAVAMRQKRRDKSGRTRYGPLFGLGDEATALIERNQPYKGGDARLLLLLHEFWNTDKHEQLVPISLIGRPPNLILQDATLIERLPDRLERGAHVVEFTVKNGTNPQVDVQPEPPRDVAFSDGAAVVERLQAMGMFVILNILTPAADLFPGLDGVGG